MGDAPVAVGIDDGFAATKIALRDGRLAVIASCGRLGPSRITWVTDAQGDIAEYETDGSRYTVGAVAGESTRFEDYPVSGLNRAIVQHALQRAGLGGRTIHAVSGLPMSAYYHTDGAKRSAAIDAKRMNLLTPVTCTNGARPAELAFHAVIPEALAAWYDYVIDDEAAEPTLNAERASCPLAIVDIGGRTTDFVVVRDQGLVHAASGSVRVGILDVTAHVSDAVQKQFDLDAPLDERIARDALETGTVRLFGGDHDVRALVEAAKRTFIEALHNATRRKLGRGTDVDTVYFVGGGAALLADDLRDWFPHQAIAPHAAFANARGMLKYLRYVCDDVVDRVVNDVVEDDA